MKEIYLKVVRALVRIYGEEEGFNTFKELITEILANKEQAKLAGKEV